MSMATEGRVWVTWTFKTILITTTVFKLPMPGEITAVVKLGIVAAVMCALVIHDGFLHGIKPIAVTAKAGCGGDESGLRLNKLSMVAADEKHIVFAMPFH
jgi:hypothetical protein